MLVVKVDGSFSRVRAVVFEPKEREVLGHALAAERQKVVVGQTNYGPMTIKELDAFIDQIVEFKNNP